VTRGTLVWIVRSSRVLGVHLLLEEWCATITESVPVLESANASMGTFTHLRMFQTVRCICVPTIVQNMAFAIKPRESVPASEDSSDSIVLDASVAKTTATVKAYALRANVRVWMGLLVQLVRSLRPPSLRARVTDMECWAVMSHVTVIEVSGCRFRVFCQRIAGLPIVRVEACVFRHVPMQCRLHGRGV